MLSEIKKCQKYPKYIKSYNGLELLITEINHNVNCIKCKVCIFSTSVEEEADNKSWSYYPGIPTPGFSTYSVMPGVNQPFKKKKKKKPSYVHTVQIVLVDSSCSRSHLS